MEETAEQIGRCLSDAREAVGLDVTDVMYLTRLPKSVLEALEAEDFAFFSSPTYAKSFLRQYSEFLKVDAEPWLEALEPGSYVAGQVLGPLLEEVEPAGKVEPAAEMQRGGLSVLWLMVLSGGMIYGAIEGFRWLEGKLEEPAQAVAAEEPENLPAAGGEPVEAREEEPALANQVQVEPPLDEDGVKPPRAIIVRE